MKYRSLGNSGLRVSEVSLGSWLTAGASINQHQTEQICHKAFDLGINLFDTADVYAHGNAEIQLGKALAACPRHHLVIASKCYFPMSDSVNDQGLSRKHIHESIDHSLQRLGMDYLDLYQCHRPDPHTPMLETVRAFDDLIRKGKILYWGVSEWSSEDIREACRLVDAYQLVRPISNQPRYNILRRSLEQNVIATCEELGIGQICYSPLGQGVLTGKYSASNKPQDSRAADPNSNAFMDAYLQPEVLDNVARLQSWAQQQNISMAQLAVSWCLRQGNVASTIVGATKTAQLEDNAGAAGVELPADLLAFIDTTFPVEVFP
ncbi:MAG: aldo/keto reductase family protein [Pseudomonadales bacterium]